jgi:hypothetical protein
MYQEAQKPRNVSAVKVALRASRDFSLIDFVKTKPTTIRDCAPDREPDDFCNDGSNGFSDRRRGHRS